MSWWVFMKENGSVVYNILLPFSPHIYSIIFFLTLTFISIDKKMTFQQFKWDFPSSTKNDSSLKSQLTDTR